MTEANDSKQEQSMEEILQSIKRIIADDEVTQVRPALAEVRINGVESDVLELTELVEIGLEMRYSPAAPPPPAADVLQAIDAHFTPQKDLPNDLAKESPKDVLHDIDSLISSAAAGATATALSSLKNNKIAPQINPQMPSQSLVFRGGQTIEDLVIEALKPELRAWIEANLPNMVERMVAAEIKKISGN